MSIVHFSWWRVILCLLHIKRKYLLHDRSEYRFHGGFFNHLPFYMLRKAQYFFLKIKVLKKSILFLKFTCPLYCSPVVDLIRLWRHQGQQCTPVIVKVSVRGPSPLQPNSPMGREHWCSPPMVCVEKSIILILRYVTSYKHSLWMKHRLSVRFFILFFIRFQWHVRLLLMNQVIDSLFKMKL